MTDFLRHTHAVPGGGQKLIHSHPGGQDAHGYFEHGEDRQRTPPEAAAPESLACGLPVFEDVDGYKWIKVGADHYMPLSGQVIRVIMAEWPAVSLAAANEVGGKLMPLTLAGGQDARTESDSGQGTR